jgi:ubiquinone/menaquinone biosynthesis C-methylase UbiE
MPKSRSIIKWTPALYDLFAKYYDRLATWFFPVGDLGREKVVSGLTSGSILDIACGTGTLLQKAQENGMHPFGIDSSRGMLIETRKKVPAARIVQASFYALPFDAKYFDYVVETNAVSGEEIDPTKVLLEMKRVCRSDGEIRIGDYGKPIRESIWASILVRVGILIGDYPHDYKSLFRSVGLEAEVEVLGWGGLYQFVRVALS